jgi:hypothetical protein
VQHTLTKRASPAANQLPAESERMREAEDELSDEAMPQLPASVHVRKSSIACSKVSATCALNRRAAAGHAAANASGCVTGEGHAGGGIRPQK